MVPDSLSQPFIRARIQPLLQDGTRATFMSVQSLAGRLLFAATLSIAAMRSGEAAIAYEDMQIILTVYVGIGIVVLAGLIGTVRRAGV